MYVQPIPSASRHAPTTTTLCKLMRSPASTLDPFLKSEAGGAISLVISHELNGRVSQLFVRGPRVVHDAVWVHRLVVALNCI